MPPQPLVQLVGAIDLLELKHGPPSRPCRSSGGLVYAITGNNTAAAAAQPNSASSNPRVALDASAHVRSGPFNPRCTRSSNPIGFSPTLHIARSSTTSLLDRVLSCLTIPARSKNGHTRPIAATAS